MHILNITWPNINNNIEKKKTRQIMQMINKIKLDVLTKINIFIEPRHLIITITLLY